MSLINFDTNNMAVASVDMAIDATPAERKVSGMKPNGLEKLLAELNTKQCVHFISDGSWSMYDFLISALLMYKDTSNVYITTYSMTELSARIIAKLKDSGSIENLHVLMDYKSKMRYPQVDQLIRNVATSIGLTHLHAKVLIITNKYTCMTVIGSANWTKNPRIEVGVIDKSTSVALSHIEWILQKINESNGTE